MINCHGKETHYKVLEWEEKGAYRLLVEMYSEEVTSMPVTIALEIIREDLRKESGEMVDLNYNSLARAAARSRKESKAKDEVGYENGISRTRMS